MNSTTAEPIWNLDEFAARINDLGITTDARAAQLLQIIKQLGDLVIRPASRSRVIIKFPDFSLWLDDRWRNFRYLRQRKHDYSNHWLVLGPFHLGLRW